MYPRVKVRKHEEEEDDLSSLPKENGSDLLFLKVIDESLSVQEKENQNDSQDLIARITNPFVPNLTPEPVSTPKVQNKLHVRPYSISRPRAVLSSPANDGMVGNRMRANNERTALRKCNSEPCKKQTQIKALNASASQAKAESSALNLRKGGFKTATINISSEKRKQIINPRIASSKLQLQKHF